MSFASNLRANLADRMERRRVYRRTLNELSNLSSRELLDLGIDPAAIGGVAYQAAYGK